MNKRFLVVPLAALTLAALACGSSTGGGGEDGKPALYRDNLSNSDSGWCVDSDDTSALDYSGGEYVFEVNDTEWFVWCNPDEDFDDIHVEVTAKNTGDTGDTVFGLICHFQNATSDFYYGGISANGDYTIRLYQDGEDQVLAEGTTDIDAEADSYKLGLDCANGEFALYLDGQKIDSASDDTYTSGDIGLFAWTGDDAPAEIHYDDIVVTAP
ncbi:MAG: hypothetical protein IT317_12885 [Anaerolineales bacterium]|nr:hypothetical protein [Anaerolineales bacterium]